MRWHLVVLCSYQIFISERIKLFSGEIHLLYFQITAFLSEERIQGLIVDDHRSTRRRDLCRFALKSFRLNEFFFYLIKITFWSIFGSPETNSWTVTGSLLLPEEDAMLLGIRHRMATHWQSLNENAHWTNEGCLRTNTPSKQGLQESPNCNVKLHCMAPVQDAVGDTFLKTIVCPW